MEENRFIVSEDYEGTRIDKYLSLLNPGLSRSYIQKLIKEDGFVTVNGNKCKNSTVLNTSDEVFINIPEPVVPNIEPEDIPLNIVYEDSDFLIINKPKDMVVHPAPGHYSGTLVNGILNHCKDLSGINGVLRPGIVHRIDKDTTGLLIICKNDKAHNDIAAQLKEHSIERTYIALCDGNIKVDEGVVDKPIGRDKNDRKKMSVNNPDGRNAVTHYKVLERFGKYTLIKCNLETGRTHQIRVHMASLGHPIVGDEVYGHKSEFKTFGQMLHAKTIGFVHPSSKEYVSFDSELPEYFEKIINRLRNK